MSVKRIYPVFILACIISLRVTAQRLHVKNIIDNVNTDSLLLTVKQLSGEAPVITGGITDTIKSRHSNDPGNEKAAQFIRQKLSGFGLTVTEQNFGTNGKNIMARQQGYDGQHRCFIVCAHYDNLPAAPLNYGADDNASGVSAVIETARLLSKTTLRFTVYYILFDQEEQNLLGSEYFANLFDMAAEPVLGSINLDMIAYDGNNDSVANIHTHQVAQLGQHITNRMKSVNTLYNTGINLRQITPPDYSSDHASLWKYFIPAVMFIEDDVTSDFNPYYHTINDRVVHFNTSYYNRMVKVAAGTLADFATDSSNVGINSVSEPSSKLLVYPNPLEGTTLSVYPLYGESARVRLMNLAGEIVFDHVVYPCNREVKLSIDDLLGKGLYQLIITDENALRVQKIIVK